MTNNQLTVLVPMAGQGVRFERAGYLLPKPLIDINGKTMIQRVVESLDIEAKYVYIVQRVHNEKHDLRSLLDRITPNCTVIEIDGLTEGSACTTLLAKSLVDNDDPLLIVNSDQILDWDSAAFFRKLSDTEVDGGILTFPSSDPNCSYADVDEEGYVQRVAEKVPISPHATVGVYWCRRGSDYVRYAEQMIAEGVRVNNEFYICPVFSWFLNDHKRVIIHEISADQMHGTGTPEDLQIYLTHLAHANTTH